MSLNMSVVSMADSMARFGNALQFIKLHKALASGKISLRRC
jgi:hypothetical protein